MMILQTKFHVIKQRDTFSVYTHTHTIHFRNDPTRAEYECMAEFTQQCVSIVVLSCYCDDDDNYCIRTKQLSHVDSPRTFLVAEISRLNAQYHRLIQKVNCWVFSYNDKKKFEVTLFMH